MYNLKIMFLTTLIFSLTSASLSVYAGPNHWFENHPFWTGADGAYTVAISENKVLWLFGDTLFGSATGVKRKMDYFIHNSIALQSKSAKKWNSPDFIIPRSKQNHPIAFFQPENHATWFWPLHGATANGKLFIFLLEIQSDSNDPVFAFKTVGNWVAVIKNPNDPPSKWKTKYKELPWYKEQNKMFGNSVLIEGKNLLIWGVEEKQISHPANPRHISQNKFLILARVPLAHITDWNHWEFSRLGAYTKNANNTTRYLKNVPIEFTIHKDLNQHYILTAIASGLRPSVLQKIANSPHGPFSSGETIFSCPEVLEEPRDLFCYAAKSHPEFSKELPLYTYVVNSYAPQRVETDASLYRPRFFVPREK